MAIAPTFEVPRFAYGAIAALAVAASVMIVSRPAPATSGALAENNRQTLSLTSPIPVTIGETLPVAATSTGSPSVHYVLPTRPVSYAPSHSF